MLNNVDPRSTRIELFGRQLPAPVLLAPVGVLSLLDKDGELAVGRAAAKMGIPMVLSSVSSHSIEDVAGVMGGAPRWFQLYWGRDRELNESLVRRAETAGYGALVITLDTRIIGWRPRDLQQAYLPFMKGEGLANYLTDPIFRSRLKRPPEEDLAGAVLHWLGLGLDPAFVWNDLAVLQERTRLPILLKGILHPEDAQKAIDCGANGIIVSNHGGRQVDGSIGALDALPAIVKAVRGRLPVLFDSGVRYGSDALKALALGAEAILLGRVYAFGLAVGGEEGVRNAVENFLAEFDLTMALSGHSSPTSLNRSILRESTSTHGP